MGESWTYGVGCVIVFWYVESAHYCNGTGQIQYRINTTPIWDIVIVVRSVKLWHQGK